jgi:ubiquitin-conjugating enzyme E2 J1
LLTAAFLICIVQPSGRFEIQKKICLSISNYHPEHWQPSWSGE